MKLGRLARAVAICICVPIGAAFAQDSDSPQTRAETLAVAHVSESCNIVTMQELRNVRGADATALLEKIYLSHDQPLDLRRLALELLVTYSVDQGGVWPAVPEAADALVTITRDPNLELPRRLEAVQSLGSFFVRDEFSSPSVRLIELAAGEDPKDPVTAKAIAVLNDTVRNQPDKLEQNAVHSNPIVSAAAAKEIKRFRGLDPKLSLKDIKLLDDSKTQYIKQKESQLKNAQESLGRIRNQGDKKPQAERVDELKKELRQFEPKRLIDYGAEQLLAFYAASGRAEEAAAAVQAFSQLARQVEQLPPITWVEQEVEVTTRNGVPIHQEVVSEEDREFDIGFWGGMFFDLAAGYQQVQHRAAKAQAKQLAEYFSHFDPESIKLIKTRVAELVVKDERAKAAQARRAKQAEQKPAVRKSNPTNGGGGIMRRPGGGR